MIAIIVFAVAIGLLWVLIADDGRPEPQPQPVPVAPSRKPSRRRK